MRGHSPAPTISTTPSTRKSYFQTGYGPVPPRASRMVATPSCILKAMARASPAMASLLVSLGLECLSRPCNEYSRNKPQTSPNHCQTSPNYAPKIPQAFSKHVRSMSKTYHMVNHSLQNMVHNIVQPCYITYGHILYAYHMVSRMVQHLGFRMVHHMGCHVVYHIVHITVQPYGITHGMKYGISHGIFHAIAYRTSYGIYHI